MKSRFLVGLIFFTHVMVTATHAATRVAVIADSPGHKLPDWAVVAPTAPTDVPELTFVDRQLVDKVLAQQQITAAINTSDQSIALGKQLSAQVLAVINSDESGLIIFDAETGVRLADVSLPVEPQKAAALLADRIKAAVVKRNLPPDQRHSIRLLTVRNVDLSSDNAELCQVEAHLIQRQLTNSPAITVLARPGSDNPNPDRDVAAATTTQTKELIAAAASLELQLAREGSDKIKITCLLSDSSGKSLGSPSVAGDENDPEKLADLAVDAICQSMHAAAPSLAGDAKAEARRFLAEAHFHAAHQRRKQAMEDAQAAFALDPGSADARSFLDLIQLMRGAELLCAFDETADSHPFTLWLGSSKSQDVDESLRLVEIAEQKLLSLPEAQIYPPASGDFALRLKLLDSYIGTVGRHLNAETPIPGELPMKITVEQKDRFDKIRIAYRRYRREIQQPLAIKAVKDRASLNDYSTYLDQLLIDSRFCFSQNCSDWTTDFANLLPPWVDLVDKYDKAPRAGFPPSHPLTPTGSAHEDPIARLLWDLPDSASQEMDPFSNGGSETAQLKLSLAACSTQDLDRLDIAFNAIQKHRDMAFSQAATKGLNSTSRLRWKGVQPVSPETQRRTPELLEGEIPAASAKPAAPAEASHPGLFWKDARTLIDLSEQDQNVRTLSCPLVNQGNVYCMAFSDEPAGPAMGSN